MYNIIICQNAINFINKKNVLPLHNLSNGKFFYALKISLQKKCLIYEELCEIILKKISQETY